MTRRRRYRARHRHGRPGLAHCLTHPAVSLRAAWRSTGWRPARHDLATARRTALIGPLRARHHRGPGRRARLAA